MKIQEILKLHVSQVYEFFFCYRSETSSALHIFSPITHRRLHLTQKLATRSNSRRSYLSRASDTRSNKNSFMVHRSGRIRGRFTSLTESLHVVGLRIHSEFTVAFQELNAECDWKSILTR